jgi:hypothetical protein
MSIRYEVIWCDGEYRLTILCKDADSMVRIAEALRRTGKAPSCARVAEPIQAENL